MASAFQKILQDHIELYKRYPGGTWGQRPQGSATVAFEMDRTGIVVAISITQSSGSEILDRAAMATVLRSQPLPHIPDALPDPLRVTVPITFAGPQ